ncbi:hypothetical protein ACS0TY_018845 [Phlomoides rotata]
MSSSSSCLPRPPSSSMDDGFLYGPITVPRKTYSNINYTLVARCNWSTQVKSPFGNELNHKEKMKYGEFAFTTTEPGNYQACFVVDSDYQNGKTVTVDLDWKIGIGGKYWDSIAKKEKN